jgi:GTP-binding protein Era
VALVGRPNVGKSTLLNALIGAHVSITSDKPQTTRHRVLGVATRPEGQYVFVDTPGLQHRHKALLNRRMNAGVGAAVREVDAVAWLVEAQGWRREDDALLRVLPAPVAGQTGRVVLVINKVDQLGDRGQLLPFIAEASARYPFAAIVPVSAAKLWQLDTLFAALHPLLPEGPALYGPEDLTDRSVRFLAGELVREQAFRLLGEEVPHGLAVAIEAWEESEGRAVISALIMVERESQRGIVIGAGGAKLRDIGTRARQAIERLLGKPVHLQTHVRVASGWSENARMLDGMGIEGNARRT